MNQMLYPTKTRLDLLALIDNGQVLTDITAEDITNGFPVLLFPDAPTQWQDRITVTARTRELEQAGWVEEREGGIDWQLTPYGRAVREVRILDFGELASPQMVAEVGDPDEPKVLGHVLLLRERTSFRWQVTVGTEVSVVRKRQQAWAELWHRACLAHAAQAPISQP